MKLRVINENEQGMSVNDAVEALEKYVDEAKGKLSPAAIRDIKTFLAGFSDPFRKRIAALLGTTAYTPGEMADQIAQGALIAYVDNDVIQNVAFPAPPKSQVPGYPDMDESHPDYYIDGPGRAELQAIEDQEAGRTSKYQSSPPAWKPMEGGCPALDQIPDMLKSRLSRLSPADFIDNPPTQPAMHQPFIYSATEGLFVGMKNSYHDGIISSLTDPEQERVVRNVYYNGDFDRNYDYIPGSALPGVVGRTGYNFAKMDKSLRHTTIVAMYAKKGSTEHAGMFEKCVHALVDDGYIPRDALVIIPGQLTSVQEMMGGGQAKMSEEDILRSELQAAYHVGTWPNGKRMTPQEKAALGKQLGIGADGMKKNPWQSEMEKAGIINPGQRWWAPYSESKRK